MHWRPFIASLHLPARRFIEECGKMWQLLGNLLDSNSLKEAWVLGGHLKDSFLNFFNFLEDTIEYGFRVGIINISVVNKNISHSLSDEFKRLHVVFVLIQLLHIVFYIDLILACLLLHFLKQEWNILIGSLSDLRGYTNICDWWPWIEEVVKKLHEIGLTYFAPLLYSDLRLCDHFEWNSSFVRIAPTFQDLHVFDEILEVDLNEGIDTYPSLSRSKALNMRSENSWAQWSPKIPMFFLKDSRVI